MINNKCLKCYPEGNSVLKGFYELYDFDPGTISLNHCLGYGSYGSVYKITYKNAQAACKLLSFSKENAESFVCEISTLKKIGSHKNIIDLLVYSIQPRRINFRMFLVYEFLNGSLESLDIKNISNRQMLALTFGTLEGVEVIHNKKILHNDLHAGNVLFDSNFTPKISDFGLASICPADKKFDGSADLANFLIILIEIFFLGRVRTSRTTWWRRPLKKYNFVFLTQPNKYGHQFERLLAMLPEPKKMKTELEKFLIFN